ncbi:MAG: hypothetical protein MPEBLZ_03442 [Candidatus Methanoperedens nitroreducens]|nr:hypothetical protein [Candidatus Methanoperedens sp. BLZ2]KPQ42002.1 MAG: hypothetical protein MPEBLZ_03442 [Candidatus Methanoperedens sp. BLZ1]MBZ0176918.1 hypothetical protein [Candidatus Methanoperedens nitroreducens]MCX9080028.1 hypothetical protein [Candidatus Methanoperedens sp.]CAG0959168.1 hypothetical protein METP2_00682 [Methanosarcinales archaeon]MCX9088850.1 hypothetical protein [Candidatus Methanoperedens sp.]
MNRNIVLITGILAAIMVFGAAVALARMGNEKVAVGNTSTIGESHCEQMEPINKQISFQ